MYAVDQCEGDHHDHRNTHDEEAKRSGDGSNFLLQRRVFRLGLVQHGGDLPHLGFHAGVRDFGGPHAPNHGGAFKYHVSTVSQGCILWGGGWVFDNCFGFACQ